MEPIRVMHFSDVLCIWAYISEARVDELLAQHPDQVELEHHFVHIFGRGAVGVAERWREKGGIEAYADHVLGVAARYGHIEVHPRVWRDNPPCSSLATHLYLRAIAASTEDPNALRKALKALRRAFFVEAKSICNKQVLRGIADEVGVNPDEVGEKLDCGVAHEILARDIDLVRKYDVRTSPTLLFNEGRQRLIGNVSFRVIDANVSELLDDSHNDDAAHSWC